MDTLEKDHERRIDGKILALMALGTLILRYLTLMEVNVGGDNIDYWYYGKSILQGYPYELYFHRSVRWGIILPTVLVQLIFGLRPWVIYLPSVLMCVLLNYTVFWTGKRFFDRQSAFLSLVIIQFFPYMIRMGSQLFLGVFSMNYILLSLLFLMMYLNPQNAKEAGRGPLWFLLSILFMFISYLTKITNLYFLFPWLILIIRYKGFKPFLIYGVILAGLYSVEHLAYFLLLGEPLGRLGIIVHTHLGNSTMEISGVHGDGTFWGLYKRYNLHHFPFYWQFLFWGGLASSAYLLKKDPESKKAVKIILLIIAFFVIFITFGVTSIHPVKSFENYHPRYFSSILPLLALLVSRVLVGINPLRRRGLPSWAVNYSSVLIFTALLMLLVVLSLFLPVLPKAASEYLHNPFKPQEHMLAKMGSWEREINEATDNHVLLRSWLIGPENIREKRNSRKSIDTVNRLYLKLPKGVGMYPDYSEKTDDGLEYRWLDYGGATPDSSDSIMTFFREPFELVNE